MLNCKHCQSVHQPYGLGPITPKEYTMLCLSRRPGQSIVILDSETEEVLCELTVNRVHGDKVSIGLQSPDHIIIHRKEVQDRIEAQAQSLATALLSSTKDSNLDANQNLHMVSHNPLKDRL